MWQCITVYYGVMWLVQHVCLVRLQLRNQMLQDDVYTGNWLSGMRHTPKLAHRMIVSTMSLVAHCAYHHTGLSVAHGWVKGNSLQQQVAL